MSSPKTRNPIPKALGETIRRQLLEDKRVKPLRKRWLKERYA